MGFIKYPYCSNYLNRVINTIGNRVRTGKTNIKDKEKRLVLIGVLMIIAPIIYIITSYIFGNLYYDYIVAPEDYQLWGSGYNPGFAFFGPFIGGALIIATAITSRKMPSKKDVLMDEEKIRSSITTIQPQFRQILNYEKSIWIITLFGGILTLFSFLTPALSVEISIGTEYFWMWGLFSIILPGFSSSNFFLPLEEPSMYSIPIFLSGLIPAILILISSVMLCITANSIRKDRNDLKSAGNKLIGWGAALILASIIYLIAIDITMGAFIEHLFNDPWNTYFSTPDMWDASKIGFAVIGPFIGGALAITSGIASKTIKPIEEP